MTKVGIKKLNTKHRLSELNCGNVLIIWNETDSRRREAIIYYKTDDHIKNKEVNDIYIGFGYTRKKLEPYNAFWETNEVFIPYKRRGVYIKEYNKDDIGADKERRDNIRKAPFLQGN